jgi:hypothetical protein
MRVRLRGSWPKQRRDEITEQKPSTIDLTQNRKGKPKTKAAFRGKVRPGVMFDSESECVSDVPSMHTRHAIAP